MSQCKLTARLGALTNLNKHMKKHTKSRLWYNKYIKATSKQSQESYLSEDKLNLIKFFITSNTALSQLKNIHLRSLIKKEISMPSFFTFRYKYINEVLDILHDKIELKCQDSSFITLIPDGWTDQSNTEYLGDFFC